MGIVTSCHRTLADPARCAYRKFDEDPHRRQAAWPGTPGNSLAPIGTIPDNL